jgi:hypothetical protein
VTTRRYKSLLRRSMDLSGCRFGRWLCQKAGGVHNEDRYWECVCDCGTTRLVKAGSLVNGRSKSCGCIGKELRTTEPLSVRSKAWQKKYRKKNQAQRVVSLKAYRKAHPEATAKLHRKHYFRSKYGIELEDAERMLEDQGGVCVICSDPIILSGKGGARVDHDHQTGEIRGVLCNRCNIALGNFRDSTAILNLAISYLKKSSRVRKAG